MAATTDAAADELARLARNLRDAGETGLKRELYQAINDAAQPIADEIQNVTHVRAYMPDRYADVLAADLRVLVSKHTTGTDIGVALQVSAPTRRGARGRKVGQRNEGILVHPVFAQQGTPRRSWRWVTQIDGMHPGFATDPVERGRPRVRQQIEDAIARVNDELWRGV